MAALLIDVYGPLYFAPTTYYADKDALKGSLINTLREVRPTYFFAVPRVWEKFEEAMVAIGRKNTGVKKVKYNLLSKSSFVLCALTEITNCRFSWIGQKESGSSTTKRSLRAME